MLLPIHKVSFGFIGWYAKDVHYAGYDDYRPLILQQHMYENYV